jgi:hypothetical protein
MLHLARLYIVKLDGTSAVVTNSSPNTLPTPPHGDIDKNRLLLISPFSASYPRATAELAGKRNQMIGAIAHTLFIAYASPNSKTLAKALLVWI